MIINCPSVRDAITDSNNVYTNYGSTTTLDTYHASYAKDAKMIFDMSGIPAGVTISSATVKLFVQSGSKMYGSWIIRTSRNTSDWSESTMTFNAGRPNIDSTTDISPPWPASLSANTWYDLDVTTFVNAIRSAGVNYGMSFQPIKVDGTNADGGIIGGQVSLSFTSREWANSSQRTYLQVVYNSAPNAPTITAPAAGQSVNTKTPTINWSFSDPDGDPQGSFLVEVVNDAYTAVIWGSGWLGGAQTSYTIPGGVITTDGPYWIRVRVQDSHGAVNTANGAGPDPSFGNQHFYVDTTPPTASSVTGTQYVTTAPGGTFRVWAYGVGDNVSGVQVVRFPTGLNATNWVWFDGVKNGGTSDWYCDIPISSVSAGGPEGRYQTDTYAYDYAGNSSYIGSPQTYVDRTGPTGSNVTGTQYVNTPVNGTYRVYVYGVTDSLSGINRVQFPVWTDAGGQDDLAPNWQTNSQVSGVNDGSGQWHYDVPINLHSNAEGSYTCHVYAFDNAGNSSALIGANVTYVDRTPPVLGAPGPQQYISGTTATVYVDGISDSLTGINRVQVYAVRPDSSYYDIGNATDMGGGRFSINVSGINIDGNWHFDFRAYDNAGNAVGPVAPYVLRDTVLPTIASVSAQQYITGTTARVWAYNALDDSSGISKVYGNLKNPDGTTNTNSLVFTRNGTTNDYYYDLTGLVTEGNWVVDIYCIDVSGNWMSGSKPAYVFKDSIAPVVPTLTDGILYAVSNGVSWSAFNDGVSSGLLSTTLYLELWDGITATGIAGFPKSVTGVSYNFTGLTPATQYRWAVVYTDVAGNASALTYHAFTTNTYNISTSLNLISSGYLLNQKPKFKFSVTDANDATLTNFQIQVSTVDTFATTILDTTSGAAAVGWTATSISSGGTNYYTPQANLGTGTFYVRLRAFDGKDWGVWSTTVTFTIQAVSWPTTLKQASVLSNYAGKVSASTVANPHKAYSLDTPGLQAPTASWLEDVDTAGVFNSYASLFTLGDGTLNFRGSGTNTYIPQKLFSIDLIATIERKYNMTLSGDIASKVAWLKDNITKLTANWYGSGVGPLGNKAYFNIWRAVSGNWQTAISSTTSTVSKITFPHDYAVSNLGDLIDVNGFVHYAAYGDASDGVTVSQINTDYFEIITEANVINGVVPDSATDDNTISKRTIDDIRIKINAVRQARGLASIIWTDTTIQDWNTAPGTMNPGSQIRTIHLIELRQAIVDMYSALAVTAPSWKTNIIDTTVERKGAHWNELRSYLKVI